MDYKDRRFKNMINIERRETVPTEEAAVGMDNRIMFLIRQCIIIKKYSSV